MGSGLRAWDRGMGVKWMKVLGRERGEMGN
jgi:hypothetical protein